MVICNGNWGPCIQCISTIRHRQNMDHVEDVIYTFKRYVWVITWTTTICQPRWNLKVKTSQSPRLQKKGRDQLALVLQKGKLTFDGVLELNTLLSKYSTPVPLRMVEICPNKTNLNIISHITWELWRLSTRNYIESQVWWKNCANIFTHPLK